MNQFSKLEEVWLRVYCAVVEGAANISTSLAVNANANALANKAVEDFQKVQFGISKKEVRY